MSRMTDSEKEALKSAAQTASSVLPKLLSEKAVIEDRIAKFQAVVDAWESVSGKRLRVETIQADGQSVLPIRKRVPKGQAPKHIDQILSSGGDYGEPELREAIKAKFGETYKRATIYTCLRRGQKVHKYLLKEKKWSWNPMWKVASA